MGWKDKFPKENRYYETDNGILYCGDCLEITRGFPEESVDLVVTSPPYDSLRTYDNDIDKKWNFKVFKKIAKNLYKIMQIGGVICWNVADSIEKRSKTLTSFKQGLYFKSLGFLMHDTIIWYKDRYITPDKTRYWNNWEFIFILSKSQTPKTFNPICDIKNKNTGVRKKGYVREKIGQITYRKRYIIDNEYRKRDNVWEISCGYNLSTKDKLAFQHPAIFPERLANDCIISWSNENDIVLDPFTGSGTTLKMANLNKRKWIGIEINPDYCEIAIKRLKQSKSLF